MCGSTGATQVHVRLWGQYFTQAAWAGVLGALHGAPASILGGAAGRAAGVPKLLEAYVNLVAVQVRPWPRRRWGVVVRGFSVRAKWTAIAAGKRTLADPLLGGTSSQVRS